MVLDKNLEKHLIDENSIDWENVGTYVNTTPNGIVIRHNEAGNEFLAIKKIESRENKEIYQNRCKKAAWEYCIKTIGKESLTYYSELYNQNILACQSWTTITIRDLIIGRAYYGRWLIDDFRQVEERQRRMYPFECACLEYWKKNEPQWMVLLFDRYKGERKGELWLDGLIDAIGGIAFKDIVSIENLLSVPSLVMGRIRHRGSSTKQSRRHTLYNEEGGSENKNEKFFHPPLLDKITEDYSLIEKIQENIVLCGEIKRLVSELFKRGVITTTEYETYEDLSSGLKQVDIANKRDKSRSAVSQTLKGLREKIKPFLES